MFTRVDPGESASTRGYDSPPPQTPEPDEHWKSSGDLRPWANVLRSMIPDRDNVSKVLADNAELIRKNLPEMAAFLAAPPILAAMPAAGVTALVIALMAALYRAAGLVTNVAARAQVVVRLQRWFWSAFRAAGPKELKAANAEFLELLIALALLVVRGKATPPPAPRNSGVSSGGLPALRTTEGASTLPAQAGSLAAKIAGPLATAKAATSLVLPDGTTVGPFAGGSFRLDDATDNAGHAGGKPELPSIRQYQNEATNARDSEPDQDFRRKFDLVMKYMDDYAYDDKDAEVLKNSAITSSYGGHKTVEEVAHYTDASAYIGELDDIENILTARMRGQIDLTGNYPSATASRPGVAPSLERARETLELIGEIKRRGWMTLEENTRIHSGYYVSSGYGEYVSDIYPANPRRASRPVLERGHPISYRQINDMYVIGVGLVERLHPNEVLTADGIDFDYRESMIHDDEHYDYRPEMPTNAEAIIDRKVSNIDFYTGFTKERDRESQRRQELLDIAWLDLSRENKVGAAPRELNPVSFALALDDVDAASKQMIYRFSPEDRSYRLTGNEVPSVDEIKSALLFIRNYVERRMRVAPDNTKRLLQFHRESANLIRTIGLPLGKPSWFIALERHMKTTNKTRDVFDPKDYKEAQAEVGHKIRTPRRGEEREVREFFALVDRYIQ